MSFIGHVKCLWLIAIVLQNRVCFFCYPLFLIGRPHHWSFGLLDWKLRHWSVWGFLPCTFVVLRTKNWAKNVQEGQATFDFDFVGKFKIFIKWVEMYYDWFNLIFLSQDGKVVIHISVPEGTWSHDHQWDRLTATKRWWPSWMLSKNYRKIGHNDTFLTVNYTLNKTFWYQKVYIQE